METVLRGAVAAAIITLQEIHFRVLHNTQCVRRQPFTLSVIALVSYQELIALVSFYRGEIITLFVLAVERDRGRSRRSASRVEAH